MHLWRAARSWIRLRLGLAQDDVERELRTHIDLEIEEGQDEGLSPAAARHRAYRTFGNPAIVREAVRDVWTWHWLEDGLRDLQYSLRTLRKTPGFTIASVLTIALGIGATTAIFSVVNAVLLRPLPYKNADRLVLVWQELKTRRVKEFPFPVGDIGDLRQQGTLFEGFATLGTYKQSLSADMSEPEQIRVAEVSTNMFDLLGVRASLGRNFVDGDGTPLPRPPQPTPRVPQPPPAPGPLGTVILSYEFWQRHFGGRPDVLNQMIALGNDRAQIVGVLEPGVELLFPPRTNVETHPDLWLATREDFVNGQRTSGEVCVIARLKPGVTVLQAQQQMDGVATDLRRRFPIKQTANVFIDVDPMHVTLVSDVRPAILALMGAVTLVLLIACANVANLLLARAARQERELAVRAALGAARGRLVRQMLTESVAVALGGAGTGLLLAIGGIRALVQIAPPSLPRLESVQIDQSVLAFTALASLLSAVAFGLLPALRASSPDLVEVLRRSGRTAGLGSGRLRSGVVVAEVALSFVLLVGSGLMLRSFVALRHVDPGYDPSHVLTLFMANIRPTTPEGRAVFMKNVQTALRALPGVENASAAFPLPLTGDVVNLPWGTEAAAANPSLFQQAAFHGVLPGYFETLHTRVVAGRTFTDADNRPELKPIILDTLLAAKAFPGEQAVGKHLLLRLNGKPTSFDVIGVVAHQRHASLAEDGREALFLTDAFFGGGRANRWIVRTTGDPLQLGNAAKAAIQKLDPMVAVAEVQPMQAFVDRAEAPTRFALVLIAAFGGIAVALASVGLYGVLSTVVRQRTAEIGVRMAFGASRASVLGLVVGHGVRLSLFGIALGVGCALGLTRVMQTMLVGVSANDPATLTAIAALFLGLAFFACGLPALRASRLDPMAALREE